MKCVSITDHNLDANDHIQTTIIHFQIVNNHSCIMNLPQSAHEINFKYIEFESE